MVGADHTNRLVTLNTLKTRFLKAKHRNRLERIGRPLIYPKLKIIDEIGYLHFFREEASLCIRLFMRRCDRASLKFTSNKSFPDWGECSMTTS